MFFNKINLNKSTKNSDSSIIWREKKIPCIHTSICTGEKVAGFKDKATGKFSDVMLIRDKKDLKIFMKEYGIREDEFTEDF